MLKLTLKKLLQNNYGLSEKEKAFRGRVGGRKYLKKDFEVHL